MDHGHHSGMWVPAEPPTWGRMFLPHLDGWSWLAVLSLVGFLIAVYVLSHWTDGAMAVAISSVIGEGIAAVVSTGFFLISVFLRGRAALRATGAADA